MALYRLAQFFALTILLWSAAAGAAENGSSGPLILISIDGLRPDYLERIDTPAIDAIAAAGVQAEWMEVVFPSFTFPVHFSLVTGLHPSQHGIVANRMRDPRTDRVFSIGNSKEVTSSYWWEGEPIWVAAERQGLRAATLFWPGSEAEIAGHRPTHWLNYKHDMPHEARVRQVLGWLDQENPPQLITLYFSQVDSMGHSHGPHSDDLARALQDVDANIGGLMKGLAERNLLETSHIILVSDHGMAEISEQRTIYLDDYIELEHLQPSLLGPVGFFWPEAEALDAVLAHLKSAHPHMTVAKPEDLPERFHFTNHPRIPPLVALADDGWLISHRGPGRPYTDARGAHGYDPAFPSMRAVFVARSPRLAANSSIGPVSALDVYPLMAHLLNITPAANEGNLSVFNAVIKHK